jgi:DNA-binding HxlR family transcriptional regulator
MDVRMVVNRWKRLIAFSLFHVPAPKVPGTIRDAIAASHRWIDHRLTYDMSTFYSDGT